MYNAGQSVVCTPKVLDRLSGRLDRNIRIVKVFLFIWLNVGMCDFALAIPRKPVIVKELQGVVKAAVWRSGFKYTRLDLDEMHSISRTTEEEVVVEAHWIVILADVKGIDADTVQAFSAYFLMNEPWDSIYLYKEDDDGHLLLWIPGAKDMKLKTGDRVVLSEAMLMQWDDAASCEYRTIAVDDGNRRKIHEFPKLKDTKKTPALKRKKN